MSSCPCGAQKCAKRDPKKANESRAVGRATPTLIKNLGEEKRMNNYLLKKPNNNNNIKNNFENDAKLLVLIKNKSF